MSAQLNDLQQVPLSVQPVDQAGASVPLPAGATVAWASDNPAVFSVSANADGVTATGQGVAVGTANLTAVLSVNGQTFSDSKAVTVTSSAITGISIVFGTPAVPAPAPAQAPIVATPAPAAIGSAPAPTA